MVLGGVERKKSLPSDSSMGLGQSLHIPPSVRAAMGLLSQRSVEPDEVFLPHTAGLPSRPTALRSDGLADLCSIPAWLSSAPGQAGLGVHLRKASQWGQPADKLKLTQPLLLFC